MPKTAISVTPTYTSTQPDVQQLSFTPEGFRMVVATVMGNDVPEHFLPARQGSLLARAVQVAERCGAICNAEGEWMSDAIYERVVSELAPQWRVS